MSYNSESSHDYNLNSTLGCALNQFNHKNFLKLYFITSS